MVEAGRANVSIRIVRARVATATLLLDRGADVNLATQHRRSPLYAACEKGHATTAILLLDRGAQVDLADADDDSPLRVSSQCGHIDLVRLLLERGGAVVDRADVHGCSALTFACQDGHDDVAALLFDRGADVNRVQQVGATPLFLASQNTAVVRRCIENGADVDLAERVRRSPLFIACTNGHVDAALLLIDRGGADVHKERQGGWNPFHGVSGRPRGHSCKHRTTEIRCTVKPRGAVLKAQPRRAHSTVQCRDDERCHAVPRSKIDARSAAETQPHHVRVPLETCDK